MCRSSIPVFFRQSVCALCTSAALSGCLSLSFGGKHEHVGVEPSNSAALLHNAATTAKLEEVQSRLDSLEKRCGNCSPIPESAPLTPEPEAMPMPARSEPASREPAYSTH